MPLLEGQPELLRSSQDRREEGEEREKKKSITRRIGTFRVHTVNNKRDLRRHRFPQINEGKNKKKRKKWGRFFVLDQNNIF